MARPTVNRLQGKEKFSAGDSIISIATHSHPSECNGQISARQGIIVNHVFCPRIVKCPIAYIDALPRCNTANRLAIKNADLR